MVGQVSPGQGGCKNGKKDQNPAHGGGALFHEMGLWPVALDILADLQLSQFPDGKGPEQKTDKKGCESPVDCSECNIPE